MAIYHLTAKTGSRSGGQSARAAAAYILRTGDYKGDVDEVLHDRSGHMPAWAFDDPLVYWDAADLYERANGRLYKSVMFALPVEIGDDRRSALSESFAHALTDAEKLPFTLAIHRGKDHNPHCHLMISERANDDMGRPPERWFRRYVPEYPERGGAKKTVALKPREWLTDTREAWAAACNQALAEVGLDARIDHRSLADQGIDRKPGKHLGPRLHKMLLKGADVDFADDIGITLADIGPSVPPPFAPVPAPAPAPSPTRGTDAPRRTAEPARDRDVTLQAVRRQARAMGCAAYDIGILDHTTGERVQHHWTPQTIEQQLQYLKRQNAQGRDILIRPRPFPLTGLILVDGLSEDAVARMSEDGYGPALSLETAPGRFQVWVRAGTDLLTSRRARMAHYLAERYGGDVDAAAGNTYGRLGGFTSGAPSADSRPFVLVRQSDTSGRHATRSADLLEATRRPAQPEPDAPGPKGGPRA